MGLDGYVVVYTHYLRHTPLHVLRVFSIFTNVLSRYGVRFAYTLFQILCYVTHYPFQTPTTYILYVSISTCVINSQFLIIVVIEIRVNSN